MDEMKDEKKEQKASNQSFKNLIEFIFWFLNEDDLKCYQLQMQRVKHLQNKDINAISFKKLKFLIPGEFKYLKNVVYLYTQRFTDKSICFK